MTAQFQYKPRKLKLHVDDPGLLDQIMKLAAHLSMTKTIAAGILGVSPACFFNFLKENEEAQESWRTGRAMGKADFIKTGYMHARSDPPTWRFLAKQKQYLGMADNPTVDKPVAALAGAEVRKLESREQLMRKILELSKKVPVDIDGEAHEVRPGPNQSTTGRALARRS
jgi:hypothetical protein